MSASRTALLSVLLGLSAVLAMPQGGTAQEGSTPESVEVVAENRGSMAAGVYALADGHMVLLGVVDPAESGTFTVTPAILDWSDEIHLVADLVGSPDWFRSEALRVRSGDRVDFAIASEVDASTVSVMGS